MTSSEFIAGKTDDELIEFIKVGRDPSDPLNTTGDTPTLDDLSSEPLPDVDFDAELARLVCDAVVSEVGSPLTRAPAQWWPISV